jgi:hypothetical protein
MQTRTTKLLTLQKLSYGKNTTKVIDKKKDNSKNDSKNASKI